MKTFRDLLKPGVAPLLVRQGGYQAVLRFNRRIVWRGDKFRIDQFGGDSREMARDAAEAILHVPDDTMTAEELQAIVDGTQGRGC